jgi:ATP-dependent DNA helicase DinG
MGREQRAAVYWTEPSPSGGAAGASPIDVSEIIRERVFYRVPSVVLTSATLTVDSSFAYVRERLGIDFDAAELVLPSSFDFREQAALYLPADAPDPRREGYAEEVARHLVDACRVVAGGALALFTSYRLMTEVAALVRGSVDRVVRVQGERPRHALLAELRDAAEPILLLATASFWEGVDVPGEALELVVIARLPFASPSDPLVAARLRQLAEEGRSPFVEYQVPQAALALKQGFGRLIRSRRDRGIVAILDGRVRSMSYGAKFLRSLPRCTVVDSLEAVQAWWAHS